MHWLSHPPILVNLTAICLVSACTPKSGDTSGDESDTAGTGTAGASETSADPPTTSATDPSDSETAGTDTPTTTPTTTDPTTTTAGDPPAEPLPAACQNLCEVMGACGLVPPQDQKQCLAGCIAPEAPGSDCAALLAAEWNCVAALSCEDIQEFTQVQPHMCLEEVQTYDVMCAQN